MTLSGYDTVLGKTVTYPNTYSPTVLQPIHRATARENLPFGMNLGKGFDAWHAFEVSWLDANQVPQVAVLRFIIPSSSPNIVESKSLKLYLNSLNFETFASNEDLLKTIKKDVGRVVKSAIEIEFYAVDELTTSSIKGLHPQAICVDQQSICESLDNIEQLTNAGKRKYLLKKTHKHVTETLFSHLLRSNCPVTNQPDWGTVLIHYEGLQIDPASLLTYICSFRKHNGFHEHCVEQVFADITEVFQPNQLMVQAWYTRRGGIDINPCRASDTFLIPKPSRLIRQ